MSQQLNLKPCPRRVCYFIQLNFSSAGLSVTRSDSLVPFWLIRIHFLSSHIHGLAKPQL